MAGRIPKPSVALRDARAIIHLGWTRGSLRRGQRYCALGAIEKIVIDDPRNDMGSCASYLRKAILLLHPGYVGNFGVSGCGLIAKFNDDQTSKQPVLDAFDMAIELAIKDAR